MFTAATKASAVNKYPSAAISATGSASSTGNNTTYTFNNVSIGTAATNRVVVVIVQTQATLSTVTVGGISATIVGSTSCYIAYAVVPTGTTATIVVTHTASTTRCYVDTYRVIPGFSTTPYASINDSTANTTSSGIAVTAGSVVVLAATNTANNTAITGTWSKSDTITYGGGSNGSANFYWLFGASLSGIASSYSGTLTTSLSSKKVGISWR